MCNVTDEMIERFLHENDHQKDYDKMSECNVLEDR